MSYVHFLDVFDPAGLPVGLSDSEAAERARNLRLTEPSPRLLALLTRIRRQPPGITVNVAGGGDLKPVEWIDGEPPRVEGDGAASALWTLILPVEDDFDALQDAVPRLVIWAKSLGLGVYDPQQEAFARQQAQEEAATQAIVARRAAQPPVDPSSLAHSDIFIVENYGFTMSGTMHTFASLRESRPQLSLREVCDTWLNGRKFDKSYALGIKRVINGLLERFPFEDDASGLWCGRHPLNESVSQGDAVWVIRVATAQLDDVLRVLLPMARGWFLTVVVPEQDFYVNRAWNPDDFSAHPMERLQALDPEWKKHRLTDKQGLKMLTKALAKLLEPRGFQQVPNEVGGPALVMFERSEMNGQVRHVVFYVNGDGLVAQVRSQRFLKTVVEPVLKCSYERFASVAEMSLWSNRYREDFDWLGVGIGSIWSELQCTLAVEDLERLILPQLEGMQTAADLWKWARNQPVEGQKSESEEQCREIAPSVGDWAAAREWLLKGTGKPDQQYRTPFRMDRTMYAARCLPDEQLFPMLDDWLQAFDPEGPLYTPRAKQLIEILRASPQTRPDAPL